MIIKHALTCLAVVLLLAVVASADESTGEDWAPYSVKLGWQEGVQHGVEVEIPITLEKWSLVRDLAGFDLTIAYDESKLSFLNAQEGELLVEEDWEYFSYGQGDCDGCDSVLHMSGSVRVIGVARLDAVEAHSQPDAGPVVNPDEACPPSPPRTLCQMHFLVLNDETIGFAPVKFVWASCETNMLFRDRFPKSLVSLKAFDVDSSGEYSDVTDWHAELPTLGGIPLGCWEGLPEKCDTVPVPLVNFYNGGVRVLLPSDRCQPGDFDGSGLPFEIIDYILAVRYWFMEDRVDFDTIPGVDSACFWSAADLNQNGNQGEISDRVLFSNRLITDTAFNYRDSSAEFSVTFRQDAASGTIFAVSPQPDKTVHCWMRFDGWIDAASEGSASYVVGNHSQWGAADLFGEADNTITVCNYTGSGRLIRVEAMTADGLYLPTTIDNYTNVDDDGEGSLPGSFALFQNYPNPFNPSTTVEFTLPAATQVQIWVYNVTGQRVRTLTNQLLPAGYHTVVWDGTNDGGHAVSSGVYFYRIEAGDYTQSKKMMLLK